MRRENRVTVLCVMHLNKSAQMQAIYRTGGSIAFVAQARAVFAVTRDTEPGSEARLFLPVKMNLAQGDRRRNGRPDLDGERVAGARDGEVGRD